MKINWNVSSAVWIHLIIFMLRSKMKDWHERFHFLYGYDFVLSA